MTTDIKFPQSPIVDTTGYANLEWQQWFLNPNFLSVVIGSPLEVPSGGTGLSSGTTGGVLYFSDTEEISSSSALVENSLVVGGGASGNSPATPVGLGTSVKVLHGNASGYPTWSPVSLTSDVSGVLPVANGGTSLSSGNSGGILGFTAAWNISSSSALTANAIVIGGGAGATPSTPVGLGTTTTVLHGNATGRPSFGAVVLSTDVSGNLSVTSLNGGSGANASTFWRGDGNWGSITGNLVTGAALTAGNDTNVTLTLGGSPTTALLNAASVTAGWTGVLGLARGGTSANLSATGGASQVLQQVSTGANVTVGQLAIASLSDVTAGTTSTTFTFDGGGSPGSTGTLTLTYSKVGRFVDLNIPTCVATTGTGSTTLTSNTALPVGVRPTSNQFLLAVSIRDGGAIQTTPGFVSISTAGIVTIFRTATGAAYTNASASSGSSVPFSLTYCLD